MWEYMYTKITKHGKYVCKFKSKKLIFVFNN